MIKPRRLKSETINEYNERVSKMYYNDGYHIKEIASKLKIDEVEVYNYVVTGGYRITTDEEREEMIRLRGAGWSISRIANHLGRSRACVRKRIESPAKINCEIHTKFTDRQLKKIKNMANNEIPFDVIAKKFKVKTSIIKCRLNHTDIKNRNKHVTSEEVEKFISYRKSGYSFREIAEICNRSKNTIAKHIHDAGY